MEQDRTKTSKQVNAAVAELQCPCHYPPLIAVFLSLIFIMHHYKYFIIIIIIWKIGNTIVKISFLASPDGDLKDQGAMDP